MGIQFFDTAKRQYPRARSAFLFVSPAKGEEMKTSGLYAVFLPFF